MKGLVRLISLILVSSFLIAAFSAQALGVSKQCNPGVLLGDESFSHAEKAQVWNPEFSVTTQATRHN